MYTNVISSVTLHQSLDHTNQNSLWDHFYCFLIDSFFCLYKLITRNVYIVNKKVMYTYELRVDTIFKCYVHMDSLCAEHFS